MSEFWELNFRDKQAMWGFEPADSAISTAYLFRDMGLKEILIPGFGYGRNAKVFIDQGCQVTGIEISQTAIDIGSLHQCHNFKVYHGSVMDMPFDQKLYDGIFCFALIHLFIEKARAKLIDDCYQQLRSGGYMAFVAISKNTAAYGEGFKLGKDRFKTRHGVSIFYYDLDSVNREFGCYGIIEAKEIDEPGKDKVGKQKQKLWYILCKKE